jgi:hypothetical protein
MKEGSDVSEVKCRNERKETKDGNKDSDNRRPQLNKRFCSHHK